MVMAKANHEAHQNGHIDIARGPDGVSIRKYLIGKVAFFIPAFAKKYHI
jgi:hypothetical protein